MDRKEEFIKAYVHMFGCTKNAAEQAYKTKDSKYISRMISWFHRNGRKSCFRG